MEELISLMMCKILFLQITFLSSFFLLCFSRIYLNNYFFFEIFIYFLLLNRVNVYEGESQDRQMITGLHTVRDVYCTYCQRVLGWKYVRNFLKKMI